MKITELLNAQPTAAPPARKMDMASLDLFAAHQRQKSLGGLAARAESPVASSGDDHEARDEHPLVAKRRTAKPSALAALAEAAVDAVHHADESGPPVATRRPRGAAKPKASRADVPVRGKTSGRTGPMTDEEKRAKQRLLVKKSYYRKIDTLNTLRETVSQLEQEYNAVVEASQQNQPKTPLPRHSISALVAASAEGELLQSFQEMAVNIDRLRHENEGLRAMAMEQSKARTRVGILVQEEFKDQLKRVAQYGEIMQQLPENLRTAEEEAEVQRALASPQMAPNLAQSPPRPRDTKPIIHMTPMTEDECIEVARDAYDELLQFRRNKDFITSGGHVFGWRDRRRIEGDQVQFALEKTFQYRTAEELATNTWRVLSTESGVNRIYSSTLRATYHLVQRVSEHNIVFYRTIDRVGHNVLLKSLILASFVQTETGYLVLFRSIDPHKRNVRAATPTPSPALQPPTFSLDRGLGGGADASDRKEIWVDMFSWGVFEPTGPNHEHCTDFFGGFVPATIAANGAFWMMEVLLIALRCESECVGPLFILQQPDEDLKLHDDSKPISPTTVWGDDRSTSSDPDHDVMMEMP